MLFSFFESWSNLEKKIDMSRVKIIPFTQFHKSCKHTNYHLKIIKCKLAFFLVS